MTRVHEADRLFTSTLFELVTTSDLDDIVRPEPCPDQDAVDLHLRVGSGALEGWAYPHDLSVGAILNRECWDLVSSDELAEKQSEEGWRCLLCLDDPPRYYPSRKQLWFADFFESLARWCDERLGGSGHQLLR